MFAAPTAGTHYLGVSSYGNKDYNLAVASSGSGGTTGNYTLVISRTTFSINGRSLSFNLAVESQFTLLAAALTSRIARRRCSEMESERVKNAFPTPAEFDVVAPIMIHCPGIRLWEMFSVSKI